MESEVIKPPTATSPPPSSPSPSPPPEDDTTNHSSWFISLTSFQLDTISTLFLSLSSFLSSLVTIASDSLHRAEEDARDTAEDTVSAATKVPSRVAEGSGLFLRRIGLGFLGAVYVCLVLMGVMFVAVLIGVGIVQFWVEEPVFVREPIHFDYTNVHPTAVYGFDGGGGLHGKRKRSVPVGHTFYVSLVLVMPESDFNRQIGVFQVTAEVISTSGSIIERSSQPCMLRFRSRPVRLMHTFVKGIPLLLGISGETQTNTIAILKHKEGNPGTDAIRLKLQPRAGTLAVPELYAAEIVLNSQLPWRKELVHNWKYTFYVWMSLYVYFVLLVIIVSCCKPLFFPTMPMVRSQTDMSMEVVKDPETRVHEGRDLHELRKWQPQYRRRKRLELFPREGFFDTVGSSASSVTVTREEDPREVVEEFSGFTDAESVC